MILSFFQPPPVDQPAVLSRVSFIFYPLFHCRDSITSYWPSNVNKKKRFTKPCQFTHEYQFSASLHKRQNYFHWAALLGFFALLPPTLAGMSSKNPESGVLNEVISPFTPMLTKIIRFLPRLAFSPLSHLLPFSIPVSYSFFFRFRSLLYRLFLTR